jgi:hypothetical protein
MKNKRILCLDFDGVINTHRSLYKRLAGYYDIPYTEDDFSEKYWNEVDGINPILLEKIEELNKSDEYKPAKITYYYYPFDNICINNCNKIIKENNADILITSTWRYTRSIKQLQEIFGSIGLYGEIIGKTDRLFIKREEEIYKWVMDYEQKNNTKIESICILDDELDGEIDNILTDYAVKDISSIKHGLRSSHIQEAKEIFNKKFNSSNIKK